MKIKIIVVDDELTARSTIKSLLLGHPRYEVARDFAEPKQALSWLAENNAQIILTDMSMPEVNGIEFIRMARAIHPDLAFVAISGYDDFNYLRECMRSSVSDYLLKHQLTRDALIGVLDTLCKRCGIGAAGGNTEEDPGEIWMRALFEAREPDFDGLRADAQHGRVSIDFTDLVVIVLDPDFDEFTENNNSREYASHITMILSDICGQVISDRYRHMVYITGDDNVVVLLSFADIVSIQYILSIISVIIGRIRNMARRLLGISLSVSVSGICRTFEDMLRQYRNLLRLLEEKLYLGGGRVYHHDAASPPGNTPYFLRPELAQRIEHAVCSLNLEDVQAGIDTVFEEIRKAHCDRLNVEIICEKLSDLMQKIRERNGGLDEVSTQKGTVRFEFLEQYRKYALNLCLGTAERMREQARARLSPQVFQAVKYIGEHLGEDISLNSCAEYAGVSYTHMSRLLKKETGMNFAEYLNRARIDKAKMLINEGNIHIKDIVKKSGFNNYNYFFKVFHDIEGITPNEYIQRAKSCEEIETKPERYQENKKFE